MNKEDYIINFERVNQLTTSVYDDLDDNTNPFQKGKFAFSVSRKLIKEYLDTFSTFSERHSSVSKLEHVIKTLEYNGILIHKSTIRDEKINKVLENE
jgi:hypothetical protein